MTGGINVDGKLYEMIPKRKSFHLFRGVGSERISPEELADIESAFAGFAPLDSGIKVKMKIVKETPVCKRGQEYCLFLYSERKDNYLQNIGYIGEQLDLYLVSKNIGTLWYGLGKPEDKVYDGLDFVIMFAIAKVDSADKFRRDMYKIKRKAVSSYWTGDALRDIADLVRFAPSACNSQPWAVDAAAGALTVYRYRKPGRIGIMTPEAAHYFNQIDIGIFLCFLELALAKNGIAFERTLFANEPERDGKTLTALYSLR